jgi:hypothetical protein
MLVTYLARHTTTSNEQVHGGRRQGNLGDEVVPERSGSYRSRELPCYRESSFHSISFHITPSMLELYE